MLWIGLTGPMGSGKSTVSAILRKLGYAVLDADQLVHQILSPGSRAEVEVLKFFGEDLRGGDGALDRRALGRVVFKDRSKLNQLESIIYPQLRSEVAALRKKLAADGAAAAFYDVPLLFEKGMRSDFNEVFVVTASEDLRRARLKSRSQMTDEEFFERQSKQMPAEEKEKLGSALIRNEGDLNSLEGEVKRALAKMGIPLPAVTKT